jgi:hypothetical protein
MSQTPEPLALLQQAFDALEATADSDIDDFDDEEEEAQAVPAQYACRKIMEAMQLLRKQLLNRQQMLALSIMLDHYGGDERTKCLHALLPEWMGPNAELTGLGRNGGTSEG